MTPNQKFWGTISFAVVLIALFLLLFNLGGTRHMAWQFIQPELFLENATLKKGHADLTRQIEDLKRQNQRLKTLLAAYEHNFIALNNGAASGNQTQPLLPIDLPAPIAHERIEIRQLYRQIRLEKHRWDQYQQEQYQSILEGTLEPLVIVSQDLELEREENREYFLELERALKLHKRLIRDVRLFHDEIKFQKTQLNAHLPYELYDLKFKLAPFARESALVDALQQAMSALSAGIYEQEAVEVLDRVGDEFTKPIARLYAQPRDTLEPTVAQHYNYNFYTLFGQKLMAYADSLAQQSDIPLGSSAFGELDHFNRRLSESLYDLYLIGLEEAIDSNYLDMGELEQILTPRN